MKRQKKTDSTFPTNVVAASCCILQEGYNGSVTINRCEGVLLGSQKRPQNNFELFLVSRMQMSILRLVLSVFFVTKNVMGVYFDIQNYLAAHSAIP